MPSQNSESGWHSKNLFTQQMQAHRHSNQGLSNQGLSNQGLSNHALSAQGWQNPSDPTAAQTEPNITLTNQSPDKQSNQNTASGKNQGNFKIEIRRKASDLNQRKRQLEKSANVQHGSQNKSYLERVDFSNISQKENFEDTTKSRDHRMLW